jgi:hypothetical protein
MNALPKELRDGATLLALENEGYVKVRQGTNPFTCIVSRRGGNCYPVCFDEEGTHALIYGQERSSSPARRLPPISLRPKAQQDPL